MNSTRLFRMAGCLFILNFLTFFIQSSAQETVTLRINPDNARGGNTADFIDSVSFIPLETNKESLFGVIEQLQVTDQYFIIYDPQTDAILFFFRDGKFKGKIKPQSPYLYFGYFSVNHKEGTISVLASTAKEQKVLTYNFSLTLVATEDVPKGVGGLRSLWKFPDQSILYNPNRPSRLSPVSTNRYDLLYVGKNSQVEQTIKPFDNKFVNSDYNSFNNFINYSNEAGTIMFTPPYEYTIWELNDKGPVKQYNLLFPQNYSLPKGFATDSVYSTKRAELAFQNAEYSGKFLQLTRIKRLGDNLLFTAINFGKGGVNSNFLYNLKSGDLISFDKISGDSTSSFIPVMSRSFLEGLDDTYHNNLFSSIPSSLLFRLKEKSEYDISKNATIAKYFKTASRNDNPIIIQFRLKSNL